LSKIHTNPDHLRRSGSNLSKFGQTVSAAGEKLDTAGQNLVEHAKGDRSGIGSVVANAMGRGVEITGKVFKEGGRVADRAGENLGKTGDLHEEADLAGRDGLLKHQPKGKASKLPGGGERSGTKVGSGGGKEQDPKKLPGGSTRTASAGGGEGGGKKDEEPPKVPKSDGGGGNGGEPPKKPPTGGGDEGSADDEGGKPNRRPLSEDEKKLVEEAKADGKKISEDDVVAIGKDKSGRIVWLEEGNEKAGLAHVEGEHGDQFEEHGISREELPDVVHKAATEGTYTGQVQGKSPGRPIFEVEHNGQTHHVAVTIGKNGFIVGANIKGEDNPFKGAKPDPKYQGDGVYRG